METTKRGKRKPERGKRKLIRVGKSPLASTFHFRVPASAFRVPECARRESNPQPRDYAYHFAFRRPFGSWSGLSLHNRDCVRRRVSAPSPIQRAWLRITMPTKAKASLNLTDSTGKTRQPIFGASMRDSFRTPCESPALTVELRAQERRSLTVRAENECCQLKEFLSSRPAGRLAKPDAGGLIPPEELPEARLSLSVWLFGGTKPPASGFAKRPAGRATKLATSVRKRAFRPQSSSSSSVRAFFRSLRRARVSMSWTRSRDKLRRSATSSTAWGPTDS